MTGAAAAKMRKKWPCVVGKFPKYWIINYSSNVMELIAHGSKIFEIFRVTQVM